MVVSQVLDENGDYHAGIDGMPNLSFPLAIKNENELVKVEKNEPTTD